jgi:hypothetical protein
MRKALSERGYSEEAQTGFEPVLTAVRGWRRAAWMKDCGLLAYAPTLADVFRGAPPV